MNNETFLKILIAGFPVAGAIIIAVVGYLFTFFHEKRMSEKKAQLERINLQLRKFYGPLYTQVQTNNAVWDAFVQHYWPKHGQLRGYFARGYEVSDEEKERWRHWMRHVFQPLNERLERIILDNGDLLQEGDLPAVFISLMAHIATYKALLKRWEMGDFSEHISICNFPGIELLETVKPAYNKLREEQAVLLGMLNK